MQVQNRIMLFTKFQGRRRNSSLHFEKVIRLRRNFGTREVLFPHSFSTDWTTTTTTAIKLIVLTISPWNAWSSPTVARIVLWHSLAGFDWFRNRCRISTVYRVDPCTEYPHPIYKYHERALRRLRTFPVRRTATDKSREWMSFSSTHYITLSIIFFTSLPGSKRRNWQDWI